jgi:putative flippase GtrA
LHDTFLFLSRYTKCHPIRPGGHYLKHGDMTTQAAEIKNSKGFHFGISYVKKQLLAQMAKFGIVGVINTAVDFGVLNALILAFGLGSGESRFFLFKSISFIVAVTNSFFLNKYYVFKEGKVPGEGRSDKTGRKAGEAGKFLLVSLAGLLVNSLVAAAVFNLGQSVFNIGNAHLLANIGALVGTALVLVSNFLGYKYFVFKR